MDMAKKSIHIGWFKGTVRFVARLSGVLILLLVLDWLPWAVDRGGMRQYPGVEELRHESGFGGVLVPSYFPESIKWPPTSVLGQKRPFMAAVMEFEGKGRELALIISESGSAGFRPGRLARFMELRQSVKADLKGRDALIETGLCDDGTVCSRLSWQEAGLYVRLFMRAPSVELIRIAESMH